MANVWKLSRKNAVVDFIPKSCHAANNIYAKQSVSKCVTVINMRAIESVAMATVHRVIKSVEKYCPVASTNVHHAAIMVNAIHAI